MSTGRTGTHSLQAPQPQPLHGGAAGADSHTPCQCIPAAARLCAFQLLSTGLTAQADWIRSTHAFIFTPPRALPCAPPRKHRGAGAVPPAQSQGAGCCAPRAITGCCGCVACAACAHHKGIGYPIAGLLVYLYMARATWHVGSRRGQLVFITHQAGQRYRRQAGHRLGWVGLLKGPT